MQRFARQSLSQTQLMESYSLQKDLAVGLGMGKIVAFNIIPPAIPVGGDVYASCLLRNDGDSAAQFRLVYLRYDEDGVGFTPLGRSDYVTLAVGEQVWFYGFSTDGSRHVIDQMPGWDNVNYRVMVWRTTPDGEMWDDQVDDYVELLIQVATSLTITLNPAQISPGDTYRQTGRLTRDDTNQGIAGATVHFERIGDVPGVPKEIGSAVTDENGNYNSGELPGPVPTELPATYQVQTHYYGSITLGLEESISQVFTPVSIGEVLVPLIFGSVAYMKTKSLGTTVVAGLAGFLIAKALASPLVTNVTVFPESEPYIN